ncbi:hypothetical protein Tco_0172977 [Tanacetum coccineum]
MVAYLEKTDGNIEFHQIMDFLTRSSIYYALNVSASSQLRLLNSFGQLLSLEQSTTLVDATVAGKPVTISEASIRSDLLFEDADGIDSLNNQAIFDNIQQMGNQLKDVRVPLDHSPVPTLTKKVLTFMVKKEDEGKASERPYDSQPLPSPPHTSEDQPQIQTDPSLRHSPSRAIPDSIPEGSGGNHGGQSSSDRSLSGNEDGLTLQSAQVKKLKKGVKPLITHHKAWMKSVALKTRLARNTSGMKRISEKRTKNKAKNKKTEHEMERRGKAKSKSKS